MLCPKLFAMSSMDYPSWQSDKTKRINLVAAIFIGMIPIVNFVATIMGTYMLIALLVDVSLKKYKIVLNEPLFKERKKEKASGRD